jgi:predicted esterase
MISEHHLPVGRTARYAILGGTDGPVSEIWIVCHGYGQRAARFARGFEGIADEGRRIVAPEALSRFYLDPPGGQTQGSARVGASWMTREDRQAEINDYVEYLDALWRQVSAASPDARLVVLGFSQGASTAARWAALGCASPSLLVLWAGSLPRDLLEGTALAKLKAIPLVLVGGRDDRFAPDELVQEEERVLRSAGLEPRIVRFDGGHVIDAAVLEELAAAIPARDRAATTEAAPPAAAAAASPATAAALRRALETPRIPGRQ